MRGRQYAFVNSTYLQQRLKALGIQYRHLTELAPTKEIREKQWADDAQNGEHKKTREALGRVFTEEYKTKILANYDLEALVNKAEEQGVERIVFFCVERKRRLVIGRLWPLKLPSGMDKKY